MKSEKKIKVIILVLGMIIAVSTISNYNFSNDQETIIDNIEIQDKTNLKIPKKSGVYTESFIHIDDNWTGAIGKGWFSGDGSLVTPYVIENVTIDASTSPTGCGILITNSKNDYFAIRNCNVINAGSAWDDAGIKLEDTNNGTLTNNTCSNNNWVGICLINDCDNNTISGNTANENINYGIYIRIDCNTNTVSGNIIKRNNLHGIRVVNNCNNNNISGNIAINNDDYGISIRNNCFNNIISGNTANRNEAGISLEINCDNNNITKNTANNKWDGICLINDCDNNNISGNIAKDNLNNGIKLSNNCNNNTIFGNTACGSQQNYGIILTDDCDINTIWGNLITENNKYGIDLSGGCDNNMLYNNSFIENKIHANDNGLLNLWDNGSIGNYWDNHTTPDSNKDGIVDDPYTWINGSANSNDSFPLVENPFPLGKIHIDDSSVHAWNWSKTAKLKSWCTGSGTYSNPYFIDGLEINAEGLLTGILIENSRVIFKIKDCKVFNAISDGITLKNTNNGTLLKNNCSNNERGIRLYNNCINNTLFDNTANSNIAISNIGVGISVHGNCNNNTISGNTVNDNDDYGIYIRNNCYNNTVSGNTANNNVFYGIYLVNNCSLNNITGNTANVNTYTGIGLFSDCNNNTISGNSVYGSLNYHGIALSDSHNNTISKNTIDNVHVDGIILWSSINNTISENTIINVGSVGLYLDASTRGSLIYLNNFTNNHFNALDNNIYNNWNNSVIGNFWDDYTGSDADDDGIGDTPYDKIWLFSPSRDYLPIYWDSPVLEVIVPKKSQYFGSTAPTFNITVVEGLGDYFWCELLGTGKIMNLTKLNGVFNENISISINQTLWSSLPDGKVNFRFYCNDTKSYVAYINFDVIKGFPPTITILGDDDDDDGGDGDEEIIFGYDIIAIIAVIGCVTVISIILIKKRLKLKRQT